LKNPISISIMTLSAKIIKHIQSGLMLFALIPIFFACNDPSALGLELENENAKTQVKAIEFVLPAKTIYIDSLRSENLGKLVFGNLANDTIFGDLKAIAYTEYTVGSGILPGDTLEYLETFVTMKFSSATTNDKSVASNDIKVYQTIDTLFNSAKYLSNMHVDYDQSLPIGSISTPFELLGDSISRIKLDDSFGLGLYAKLDSAGTNNDYEDSLKNRLFYFPALVFEPSDNNGNLITFNLAADTVGIYVAMRHPVRGDNYYFKFSFSGNHYSEILRNRSSGKYTDLVNDYDSSSVTAGNVHLNMIAGVHPRIDLSPYLDFIEFNPDIIINRAEIYLESSPIDNELIPPIDRIQFYFPNEDGRINGPGVYVQNLAILYTVLTDNGYFQAASGGSNVLTTSYSTTNQWYANNMTNFCQKLLDSQLAGVDYVSEQLIVYSPDITTVGQSPISKSGIKLKVFYTQLK
jgi:hypothetical protein